MRTEMRLGKTFGVDVTEKHQNSFERGMVFVWEEFRRMGGD
jgi:hypothetical protein